MKAMEKYLKSGMDVADIGMGSGILSICAMKMGAKSAYGCDIDETVIDVAKENAVKNGINVIDKAALPQGEGSNSYSLLEGEPKSPISEGGNCKCIESKSPEQSTISYAEDYPPLEGGSKSLISGWGQSVQAIHKFPPQNQQLAKYMRNNPTDAEYKLWYYLRNKQIDNVKFRRQQPIGNYIVDFVSFQKKIIIELDGGQHNEPKEILNDVDRDRYLIDAGYRILRFWNNVVLNNVDSVLDCINQAIQENDPTPKLLDYREYIESNPNYSAILTLPQGEGRNGHSHVEGESKSSILTSGAECTGTNEVDAHKICALKYSPLEGEPKSPISVWGNCYFELGTADKINRKFDFVMANILHNVLNDIMGDLKNLLKPDGYLSLSGILDEKKPIVLEAIKRENLKIIDEMHQDQWVGVVVRRT